MHPNRDELARYLLGSLPESKAEWIERHLEECPDCDTTVDRLNPVPDTVVEKIRAGRPADRFAEEMNCQEVLRRLCESRGDLDSSSDASRERESADHFQTIQSLRDYRLLEELGRGGMGVVYKALHTHLDRVVALKLLPAHRMRDAGAVARFEREMRALGKLEHPNIVRATDAGEFAGMRYLVTELVEGVDLARLVNRLGPLDVPDACEVIRQAAYGLQHAFERGLVHRDIKPSNLMLAKAPAEAGRSAAPIVKILDMGLVLLEEPLLVEELSSPDLLMGTLDYMAPEQASHTHQVDIRADIYSLGATLYKLLTGEAPLGGAECETAMMKLFAIAQNEPRPIRDLRPEVPEELARTIHRFLAKCVGDRPASPAQVAEFMAPYAQGADLAGLLERYDQAPAAPTANVRRQTVPVLSKVPPHRPRERNSAEKRRRIAVALAGISTVLLLGLLSWRLGWLRLPTDGRSPSPVEPAATANSPTELESEVIAWIRSLGGGVGGTHSELGYVVVGPGEPIPEGNFDLVMIDVTKQTVADADFSRLDGLPHLTSVIAAETPIGDGGVAALGDLPELKELFLQSTNLTDAGLAELMRYQRLEILHVSYTNVTDAGLESVRAWPELRELFLIGCPLTDKGLEALAALNHLERLQLDGTLVTQEGVERLSAALPHCTIESQFGVFGPEQQ